MIALKNDPIWEEISEFGLPYAPFDYNSGMDVKDVDYDEAVELGLIDEGETEKPEEMGLNDGLQMSPGIDDPELEAAVANILEGIARFTAEGIVKFIGAGS